MSVDVVIDVINFSHILCEQKSANSRTLFFLCFLFPILSSLDQTSAISGFINSQSIQNISICQPMQINVLLMINTKITDKDRQKVHFFCLRGAFKKKKV